MSFVFKRKEAVSKALCRLGRGRIEAALKCLKAGGGAEAIHNVRREIKKTRAVLKLARADISSRVYGRQTERLRQAARCLASSRDAYVLTTALESLTARFKARLGPDAFGDLRRRLHDATEMQSERAARQKTVRTVRRILEQVGDGFDRLDLQRGGWKVIAGGVKAAYRKGRRAYRTARDDPQPRHFHEWRKRAKELWHDAQLLCRIAPGPMKALATELRVLSDHLGDDHDLFLLRQAIAERGVGSGEREMLIRLIRERQIELRASALAVGARFYTEKPAVFCERLERFWQAWRGTTDGT